MRSPALVAGTLLLACVLPRTGQTSPRPGHTKVLTLTLGQSIQQALRASPVLKEAEADLEIARAQLQQARSGYMPRVGVTAGSLLLDAPLQYRIPPNGLAFDLSGTPIGALFKDPITNTQEMQIGFTNQWINFGLVTLLQPLFTGGMVTGYYRQAKHGQDIARHGKELRRQETIFAVVLRYNDTVLARRLLEIGETTLIKVRTVHDVTRNVYQAGSTSVNKLDYLKSKLMVAAVTSVVERLRQASKLAHEGLRYTIGLDPGTTVALARAEFVEAKTGGTCDSAIDRAQQDRPEALQVQSGLRALKAGVDVAWSRYLPDLALMGGCLFDDRSLRFTDSHTCAVGLVLNYNLFEGLYTRGRVAEARARLRKLETKREQLQAGIAIQVRKACLDIERSQRQLAVSTTARADAAEYLRLAERAYQADLIGYDEVFKAQFADALAHAQLLATQHQLSSEVAEWHKNTGDLSSYLKER